MKYKVISERTPEDLQHKLNKFSESHKYEIVSVQYSSAATSIHTAVGSKVYVFHSALVAYHV